MSSSKTIESVLADGIKQLSAAAVDAPRTDMLVLLENVLKRDRTWILAHQNEKMPAQSLSALPPLLNRRLNREPLAYIVGERDFYGLKLIVTPDVLIPRPETEALVEYIVAHAPENGSVIDVGTGSGAIALAVKSQRPDLHVVATDVSEKALQVAERNRGQNNLNIKFVHSNLLDSVHQEFDVIAANLPYVPVGSSGGEELSHEPGQALYSGDDGLDHYRRFIPQIASHLRAGGCAVLEHDPMQYNELTELAQQQGLEVRSITDFVTLLSPAVGQEPNDV